MAGAIGSGGRAFFLWDQKKYKNEIKQKQKLSKDIDKKIEKLIREALANSKRNDGGFKLSEEAQLISKNFNANKGRLPSPVIRGNVVLGFGKQPHSIVKTATIQSNGVVIATEPLAQVRSVFEGEVMSVIFIKGSNPSILIRHGNFITLYTNLSKLYVKKGEKVNAKQLIGEVFTNKQTGQTQLQFGIFNNVNALNPKDWVYQM